MKKFHDTGYMYDVREADLSVSRKYQEVLPSYSKSVAQPDCLCGQNSSDAMDLETEYENASE
jgi:hypothetical protein